MYKGDQIAIIYSHKFGFTISQIIYMEMYPESNG